MSVILQDIELATDDFLVVIIREAVATAKQRPNLAPIIRQLLADELHETIAEGLLRRGLICDEPSSPREPARQVQLPFQPRRLHIAGGTDYED